jgi:guanine deaminase
MASLPTIFYGAVINPQSLSLYQALPNCLLAVSSTGEILWVVEDVADFQVQETLARKGCLDSDLIPLKRGEFIMPGLIDTHTHAPQVPNLGSGQQYELLDWLSNVTFPTETKFSNVEFARQTYKSVVRRIIDSGTTTCCYYGTLHLEATKALADIVHSYGQRAFVGKCNMDRNSPESYSEPSPEASIEATKALIAHIRALPSISSQPFVHPILTPRFAISCSSPLLSSLGALAAADTSLHIQTHISENPSEITFTKSLFPDCKTYAGVYDKFGLLRENTVLAHAVHLEDDEVRLIAERRAGISHCPTSNFNLSSGVARIGELLDRGIKVGLGTDVSGGFSPSILTAVQHASIASKVVAMQPTKVANPPTPPEFEERFSRRQFSVATLLYLATLGGAQVCDLDKQIGSLTPGKSFDALLVNVRSEAGNPGLWDVDVDEEIGEETLKGMLEKFLFCGDDRNISRVYVQGRLIGGKECRT